MVRTDVYHPNHFLSLAHEAFLLYGVLAENLAQSGPFLDLELDSSCFEQESN